MLQLFAFVCLSTGHAQAPADRSANEIALARKQFLEGVRAASTDHWPEALAAFERSYGIYPHPETLINIAGARRQLGKLVAASEAYQRYLRTTDEHTAENRALAEAALSELSTQVAHMVLSVRHLEPADLVSLDGHSLARSTLGLELPVDPGAHTVTVQRGSREIARRSFVAEASSRADIALELEHSARVTPADSGPSIAHERGLLHELPTKERQPEQPLRRKWWLWTAVGVVVASGVVAGTMLWPRDPKPYSGDYNGEI